LLVTELVGDEVTELWPKEVCCREAVVIPVGVIARLVDGGIEVLDSELVRSDDGPDFTEAEDVIALDIALDELVERGGCTGMSN
jgi:hypothetical protein